MATITSDKAPGMNSYTAEYPKPSGNAVQHFPGSNAQQCRPNIVKRDADVCAPYIGEMGQNSYCYAPPANKKKGY